MRFGAQSAGRNLRTILTARMLELFLLGRAQIKLGARHINPMFSVRVIEKSVPNWLERRVNILSRWSGLMAWQKR